MRRRTRRMGSRRPLLYVVVLAALVGASYLHDRFDDLMAAADEAIEGTVLVEPADATPAESPTGTSVPTEHMTKEGRPVQPSAEKATDATATPATASSNETIPATVYRAGWAELPDERVEGDRRYVHHLCGGEGASATWRSHTACFSVEKQCPVWVAFPLHECYRGDSGRTGTYRFDPALPVDIQPSLSRSYGEFTRGHLLASADRTVSVEANRATFMPTNIAPQTQAGFNAAGGAWNNLEDFVADQVCADTLYVVTGCLFGEYEDVAAGRVEPRTTTNKNDGRKITVPTAYYKVLLRTRTGHTGRSVRECRAEELKCAAFVVAHRGVKGREVTRAEMMSVADMERLAGERFFVNVPAAPKSQVAAADWGL